MSKFVLWGLALAAASLIGCNVELRSGGIGGNVDFRDPNVEYFAPDESDFELQREDDSKPLEHAPKLESAHE